jgi:hypothetical protein
VKIISNGEWFVGYIGNANSEDLAEALRQHPQVEDKESQSQSRSMELELNKEKQCRMKIYKRIQCDVYPTLMDDTRYPVTAGTKANIKFLRENKKAFKKHKEAKEPHNPRSVPLC